MVDVTLASASADGTDIGCCVEFRVRIARSCNPTCLRGLLRTDVFEPVCTVPCVI
jgi:hypothetical protein